MYRLGCAGCLQSVRRTKTSPAKHASCREAATTLLKLPPQPPISCACRLCRSGGMMRTKVVAGSLVGALSIHAALVACSMSGGMSNALQTMSDAAADVLNLETRDAHADDGATPACSCPVLPAPADVSFSLRIDLGAGAQEPMADYSSAAVSGSPAVFPDGTTGSQILGAADFYTQDNKRHSIACYASVRSDKTIVSGSAKCGSEVQVQNMQITTLADDALEFRVPRFSYGSITYTDMVFRAHVPSAHFLTPPRAYRP